MKNLCTVVRVAGATAMLFLYACDSGNSPPTNDNPLNNPPVARDDVLNNIPEIQPSLAITTLLDNDEDPDGDAIIILSVDGSNTTGRVELDASRGVRYFLDGQFEFLQQLEAASDSFRYTISDTAGGTAEATVTLNIVGVNDRPVTQDDTATVSQLGTVQIDVLGNDSDIDTLDQLVISNVTVPQENLGLVTVNQGGTSLTYDPNGAFNLAAGETVTETFTYEANDQQGIRLNNAGTNLDRISTNTASVTVTITDQ